MDFVPFEDLYIPIAHTPIIWCDNIGAISLTSNLVFHARTKHIEIDYHYIQERVMRKELVVRFVSTIDQLANIFTMMREKRQNIWDNGAEFTLY